MIRQLAHACITTRDLEGTMRFYRDVLGLPVAFRFLRHNEVIGCYFNLGNRTFLECFRQSESGPASGGLRHFCFEVDDVDCLERRLEESGYEPRGKRMGVDGSPQLWCRDPNGIDIEFQQYVQGSCQLTGQDCHVDW